MWIFLQMALAGFLAGILTAEEPSTEPWRIMQYLNCGGPTMWAADISVSAAFYLVSYFLHVDGERYALLESRSHSD